MNYRNAKYIDDTRIDCELDHPVHGWIPYTMDPSDTDMTINNDELIKTMVERADVAAYVPPTEAELYSAKAAAVRAERDVKLSSEVDIIVGNPLRWAEVDQVAWATYRQSLLAVPDQIGFPHDVVWPTKP